MFTYFKAVCLRVHFYYKRGDVKTQRGDARGRQAGECASEGKIFPYTHLSIWQRQRLIGCCVDLVVFSVGADEADVDDPLTK